MNYSDNLNKVIQLSKSEAKRLGCSFVTPDHLLLGMLGVDSAKARDVLREAGVNIAEAQHHIEQRNLHTGAEDMQPQFDKQSERILRILDLEAKSYKADIAHTEHLLMALLRERINKAAIYLQDNWQVSYESMERRLPRPVEQPKMGMDFSSDLADDMPEEDRHQQPRQKQSDSKTPALDKFGKDLTRQAEEGKLDPVIGRESEIERVVEILSRRKKNNPILIGEPGVGKSAIVE